MPSPIVLANDPPAKVLAAHEREKGKGIPRGLPRAMSILFSVCGLYGCRHFAFSVLGGLSTDGLLGKEAKILLRELSAMLAEKWWEKPHPEFCGYVNARMSIDTAYGESFGFLQKGYSGGDIDSLIWGGSNRSLSPIPYLNVPVIGQYLDGIGAMKDH
jgi:hypothetical protein